MHGRGVFMAGACMTGMWGVRCRGAYVAEGVCMAGGGGIRGKGVHGRGDSHCSGRTQPTGMHSCFNFMGFFLAGERLAFPLLGNIGSTPTLAYIQRRCYLFLLQAPSGIHNIW